MEHHPIFSSFSPVSHPAPKGCQMDFLGTKFRCEFDGCGESASWSPPEAGEEYFEWIALLESVAAANGRFVMVELGAGYGRWALRGASAARRGRNIPFHLVAVEADPQHFEWLKTAMADNQVEASQYTLIEAAVAAKRGHAWFMVETPKGDSASTWFGQRLADLDEPWSNSNARYCGRELVVQKSGFRSIRVRKVTLKSVLEGIPLVDLIDMDIQGAELEVVDSSIELLDRKVKRLHIGTHGREIEEELRHILWRAGWHLIADYGCGETCDTTWGPVLFSDGVQTWLNPRLTGQKGMPFPGRTR